MAFLDPVLNPILQPLLNASPFWAIVVLAFIISLIITLVYKLVTDQNLMKSLKEKQKDYQKKMKELRSQPEKMMAMQKEAMATNMQYMKMSFKPTLITMLPILLIFGWMSAHLMFEPIYPGESYSVTAEFAEGVVGDAELVVESDTQILNEVKQSINGAAVWNLKSAAGEHYLTIKQGDTEQAKKVLITTEMKYEPVIKNYDHSDIKKITVNHKKLKPLGQTSIFGWQPGWLGLYIIFSVIFSMALRKVMKIY